VRLAKLGKVNGVKFFVFASSCSMYCLADDTECREGDKLSPLTAYARSKVMAEEELESFLPRMISSLPVTGLRLPAEGQTD
jgi:nucleoside-diphosphate-sugar epimerase